MIAGSFKNCNQQTICLQIPTHGRAKAGQPARTYIQQLCEDNRMLS